MKTCVKCKKRFKPKRWWQKLCSKKCRWKFHRKPRSLAQKIKCRPLDRLRKRKFRQTTAGKLRCRQEKQRERHQLSNSYIAHMWNMPSRSLPPKLIELRRRHILLGRKYFPSGRQNKMPRVTVIPRTNKSPQYAAVEKLLDRCEKLLAKRTTRRHGRDLLALASFHLLRERDRLVSARK